MSLNKKDCKVITKIVVDSINLTKKKEQPVKKERDVADLAFKAVSTLSMAMIVWIFSTTNELKQDVEVIKNNDKYTSESLKELKDYTKMPKFTKDNFNEATTPIMNNTNKNTIEINNLSSFMKDVESRLIKLEYNNNK